MAFGNGARRWRPRPWATVITVAACVVILAWNYVGSSDGEGESIHPRLIARVIDRELLAREAMGDGLWGRGMGWWLGLLGEEELVEALAAYERAASGWSVWEVAGEDAGFWDDLSMAVAAWRLGEGEQAERLAEFVRNYPGWEELPTFAPGVVWEGERGVWWREIWVDNLRAFEGRRDMLPHQLLEGYEGLFGEPLPEDLAAVRQEQLEVKAVRQWAMGLCSLVVVLVVLVVVLQWCIPRWRWRVVRVREVRMLAGAGVWRAAGAGARGEVAGFCLVMIVAIVGHGALELVVGEGDARWAAESVLDHVNWALFLLVPAAVAILLLFPGWRAAWRGLLARPLGAWSGWWRLVLVVLAISWAGNGLLYLMAGEGVSDWVGDVLEDGMLAPGWEGWLAFGGSAFVAVVAAPIGEEILYRGILFGGMRRKLGVVGAAVVVNLIFAASHYYSFLGFCSVMLDGLLFTYLYWRTGSLWAPILMHAGFNLFAVVPTWLSYGVL
jgi:membrane protease YdiL (CAAX protease family)